MNGFDTNRLPTFNGTVRSRFLFSLSKRDVGENTMSNIATPNIVGRHHLIHCAAVALALSTAFVIVTMPKPDTAAASTTDNEANNGFATLANGMVMPAPCASSRSTGRLGTTCHISKRPSGDAKCVQHSIKNSRRPQAFSSFAPSPPVLSARRVPHARQLTARRLKSQASIASTKAIS
jgi:hypothetical protein